MPPRERERVAHAGLPLVLWHQGTDEELVGDAHCRHTKGTPAREELESAIRPDDEAHGTGSGYVVDGLRPAREVAALGSHEAVVRAAVALGRDTDTTACVAGGIAGLRFGSAGIPERWRTKLRGRELYAPILARLVEREPEPGFGTRREGVSRVVFPCRSKFGESL